MPGVHAYTYSPISEWPRHNNQKWIVRVEQTKVELRGNRWRKLDPNAKLGFWLPDTKSAIEKGDRDRFPDFPVEYYLERDKNPGKNGKKAAWEKRFFISRLTPPRPYSKWGVLTANLESFARIEPLRLNFDT